MAHGESPPLFYHTHLFHRDATSTKVMFTYVPHQQEQNTMIPSQLLPFTLPAAWARGTNTRHIAKRSSADNYKETYIRRRPGKEQQKHKSDKQGKEALEEKVVSEQLTERTSQSSLQAWKVIPESTQKSFRSQAASAALKSYSGLRSSKFHSTK